jgi:hypothetical protein
MKEYMWFAAVIFMVYAPTSAEYDIVCAFYNGFVYIGESIYNTYIHYTYTAT